MPDQFSVRLLERKDISHVVNYWQTASEKHLNAMGIEKKDLSALDNLEVYMTNQLLLPYSEKSALYTIGLLNNEPYGHCYINSIDYGNEAHMHLHVWNFEIRQKGLGTQMVKQAIPLFFKHLKLKTLICEPYALNPAANKTLEKLGFQFENCYTSTPSGWDFKLKVNRWKLTRSTFKALY